MPAGRRDSGRLREAPVRDAVLGFAGLQVSRRGACGAARCDASGVSRRRAFARFPACDVVLGFAGLQVSRHGVSAGAAVRRRAFARFPACDAILGFAGLRVSRHGVSGVSRRGAGRLRGSRLVTQFWALPVCRCRGAVPAGCLGAGRLRRFPVRDAVSGFAGLRVSRRDASGVSRRRAFARFPACDVVLGFAGLQVSRHGVSAGAAARRRSVCAVPGS